MRHGTSRRCRRGVPVQVRLRLCVRIAWCCRGSSRSGMVVMRTEDEMAIFTFAFHRCGRESSRNGLLALPRCSWAAAAAILVLVFLGRRGCCPQAVASTRLWLASLQPLFHLTNAPLEGLELRSLAVNLLLPKGGCRLSVSRTLAS